MGKVNEYYTVFVGDTQYQYQFPMGKVKVGSLQNNVYVDKYQFPMGKVKLLFSYSD